jgi:TetR/AcrR family transcriptional repressor of nem operon
VKQAARLVRERGVPGASVNDVMGAAGLTRGGFYAHFTDKTAMVIEALAATFAEARTNLVETIPEEGEAWASRAADKYLTEAHLDAPGRGCVIVAAAADVARSEPALRKAFQQEVEGLVALFDQKLSDGCSREEAVAFLATCVGTMVMARAVHDRSVAREILAAGRRAASGIGRAKPRR